MKKKNYNNVDADLDNLMENCLKNKKFTTMKKVLKNCTSTYNNHDYYYDKMMKAIEDNIRSL